MAIAVPPYVCMYVLTATIPCRSAVCTSRCKWPFHNHKHIYKPRSQSMVKPQSQINGRWPPVPCPWPPVPCLHPLTPRQLWVQLGTRPRRGHILAQGTPRRLARARAVALHPGYGADSRLQVGGAPRAAVLGVLHCGAGVHARGQLRRRRVSAWPGCGALAGLQVGGAPRAAVLGVLLRGAGVHAQRRVPARPSTRRVHPNTQDAPAA